MMMIPVVSISVPVIPTVPEAKRDNGRRAYNRPRRIHHRGRRVNDDRRAIGGCRSIDWSCVNRGRG